MKLFTKINGLRLFLAVCTLFCSAAVFAQNRLYIEPFAIGSYETVNVPVMLENTDAVAGFQFDVVLPSQLEFNGKPFKNEERLLNGHTIAFRNNRVLVSSAEKTAVVGNSGAVMYLPLRLKAGELVNSTVEITLKNITMTNGNGNQSWKQDPTTTAVEIQEYHVEGYAPEAEFVINPAGIHTFEFAMRNDCPVQSLQLDVKLPEGFAFVGKATNSQRCSATAYMSQTLDADNSTRFIMYDLSGDDAVTGTEGVVFSINVQAPAGFTAEDATIEVSGLTVSYAPGKDVNGTGYTVRIINGLTAYNTAKEEVENLRKTLEDALAEIATSCPDVKDSFTGEDITAAIDELASAVDEAYDNQSLTSDYEGVMAPVKDIEASIAKLIEDATAAQATFKENERVAANKAAYDKVMEEIAALQAKLDAAEAEAAEISADADVTAEVEAAQTEIDNLKAGADAALAAVAQEGNFEYTVDGTQAEALIAAVIAEAQRVAANKAAYDKVMEEIAALQDKVDAAAKELTELYPDVDVAEALAAVQAKVDEMKAGADEALEAVAEEGVFEYTVDGTEVENMLAAVKENAERVAANNAAYKKVADEIAALQAKLDTAKAEAAEISADADVTEEVNAAQAEIDKLKSEAEAALAAVAEAGEFEYTVDGTEAEKLIAAVTAEAERVAANTKAYNDVMSRIDELEDQLNEAISEVIADYPDASVAAEIIAAQNAIAAARQAAEAEADRVAESGEYSYVLNADVIEGLIKTIIEKAISGIDNILIDNLTDDVRLFDLNGREVINPVRGTIVVVLSSDGTAVKALVK